jgi:hypothetical protein
MTDSLLPDLRLSLARTHHLHLCPHLPRLFLDRSMSVKAIL